MDFQNTFLGGNDFSTSTAKQLFFDNQILAWELLNSLISRDFRCIAVSSPLVISRKREGGLTRVENRKEVWVG